MGKDSLGYRMVKSCWLGVEGRGQRTQTEHDKYDDAVCNQL